MYIGMEICINKQTNNKHNKTGRKKKQKQKLWNRSTQKINNRTICNTSNVKENKKAHRYVSIQNISFQDQALFRV